MKRRFLICIACMLGIVSFLVQPACAAEIKEENIVTKQVVEADADNTDDNIAENVVYGSGDAAASDIIDNTIEQNSNNDLSTNSTDAIDEHGAQNDNIKINDSTENNVKDTISATPTLSPAPTQVPEKWYKITFKDVLLQLSGAMVLFVIPGCVIYYRAKH